MTKTKRQLRAEAVGRLQDCRYHTLADYVRAMLGWGHEPHFEDCRDALIDLLTDDEPPEGDAVAILRKAAKCTSVNTSVGDVLRYNVPGNGGSAWQTEEDACEALADMIERDYMRREECEGLEHANKRQARKIHDVCEANSKLKAERDELEKQVDSLIADIGDTEGTNIVLERQRDEWKTKCETREVAYKQADAERKRYSEQIDELRAERDEWKAKAEAKSAKRAAAVERLKNSEYHTALDDVCAMLGWGHEPHFEGATDALIDLLTDEDANDGLSPENDVSASDVDANDANATQDSREKLDDRWYAHGGVMQLTRENVEKLRGIVMPYHNGEKQAKLRGKQFDQVIFDELHDSREQLEADVQQILRSAYMLAWMHGHEDRRGNSFEKLYVEFYNLLDRQAAITERELCEQCEWQALAAMPDKEAYDRIADLQAKVTDLQIQLEAMSDVANDYRYERDELQERVDTLTRYIHDIKQIARKV